MLKILRDVGVNVMEGRGDAEGGEGTVTELQFMEVGFAFPNHRRRFLDCCGHFWKPNFQFNCKQRSSKSGNPAEVDLALTTTMVVTVCT